MFIHPQWGYSCKLIKVGTGRETGVSWKNKQYLVLLFLNPSVWDAELEESLNSRPAQSTYRLTGQPALHRKTKGTGWVGAPLLASQPSLYLVSRFKKIYIFIYLFWFFETRFLCVALAALELSLQTRLALNSEIHLPLPPRCWDQRRVPLHPAENLKSRHGGACL